jgi:hypothetical protein
MDKNKPFLFQFVEEEPLNRPLAASPEKGGESNPKEEEPPKEPTKKGPYGD